MATIYVLDYSHFKEVSCQSEGMSTCNFIVIHSNKEAMLLTWLTFILICGAITIREVSLNKVLINMVL